MENPKRNIRVLFQEKQKHGICRVYKWNVDFFGCCLHSCCKSSLKILIQLWHYHIHTDRMTAIETQMPVIWLHIIMSGIIKFIPCTKSPCMVRKSSFLKKSSYVCQLLIVKCQKNFHKSLINIPPRIWHCTFL